jgi:hypothetical protein
VEFVVPAVPVVSVSPTTLAFGNVGDGKTGTQSVTLSNTGGAAFTGMNLAFTGPYTQTGGTCTGTLNAGASCTINVTFTPTGLGAENGSLTITGNAVVTGSPVTLTGAAVQVPAATLTGDATCGLLPNTCFFGVDFPGSKVTHTFTLKSTGSAPLATITVLPLTGSADYSITGNNCPAALVPGASCTITVQFVVPARTGVSAPSGSLSVNDNAGTQTINLASLVL